MSSRIKIRTQDIWLQKPCSLPFYRVLVFSFGPFTLFVLRDITENGILMWMGQQIHFPGGKSSSETASRYQLLGESRVKVKETGRPQWTLRASFMPPAPLANWTGRFVLASQTVPKAWRTFEPGSYLDFFLISIYPATGTWRTLYRY